MPHPNEPSGFILIGNAEGLEAPPLLDSPEPPLPFDALAPRSAGSWCCCCAVPAKATTRSYRSFAHARQKVAAVGVNAALRQPFEKVGGLAVADGGDVQLQLPGRSSEVRQCTGSVPAGLPCPAG